MLPGDISTESRVTSLLPEISRLPKQGKVATGQSCEDLGSEDNSMPLLMGWIFSTAGRERRERGEGVGTAVRVKFLTSPLVQQD